MTTALRALATLLVLAACSRTAQPGVHPRVAVGPDVDGIVVEHTDAMDTEVPDTDVPAPLWYAATAALRIRTAPDATSALRGAIASGASFEILGQVDGPGCDEPWLVLPAHGYTCSTWAEPTEVAPVAQPALLTYDPPLPSEYDHYVATGEYDDGQPEALVPGIYAKRYRRFRAPLYRDLEAWEAGDPPVGHLDRTMGAKYHYQERVESSRGPVLVRGDGKVSPVDQVYLYPVSRLQGRDLESDPLAEGLWPAFAIDYAEARVRVAPDPEAEVHHTLPYHTPLVIRSTPVGDGRWWAIPDALGPGVDGYVDDRRGIRHPVPPEARPEGVGDDTLWIGIELGQQVIQLFRGDALVWFGLTSTGAAPMGTPAGTYTITERRATRTMRSRPGTDAREAYCVEDVPWTMYFKPAYALHGAYWHWGFGRTASHGCVNLAPRDALYLWQRVAPAMPDGWSASVASDDEPGTVVLIWRASRAAPG